MDNNNGKGIFYGVIGVATLVVAIIGATFAYFGATVTPSGDAISGATNDNIAANMSLTVQRLYPSTGATGTSGLVPANIDGTNTLTDIQNALSATTPCVDSTNGYVGCHVYKITASSSTAAAVANLNLKNLSTTATTDTDWHYAIYTSATGATNASDTTAGALVGTQGDFTGYSSAVDMHNAAMTANTNYYYYLIIYLTNDENNSQNDSTQTGTNTSQTGTYSGEVELSAAGGHVSATFGT